MRQVLIYSGKDGYWVAEVSSLPGCISQGKTREEAITNIKEAIETCIIALKKDCIPVYEQIACDLRKQMHQGTGERRITDFINVTRISG